jgi:hypothetical protein
MQRLFLYASLLLLFGCSEASEPLPSIVEQVVPAEDDTDFFGCHFELYDGLVFLKVSVDDSEPLDFIFDSGAGTTNLNSRYSFAKSLTTTKTAGSMGGSGMQMVPMLEGSTLTLEGGITIDSAIILITDLSHLERMTGRRIDGIIGSDLLWNYMVTVNYSDRQLIVYPDREAAPALECYPIEISLDLGIPMGDATMTMGNGEQFEGRFLFDTGAKSSLILTTPTSERTNAVVGNAPVYLDHARGVTAAQIDLAVGRCQAFEFAGQSFNNVPVAMSSSTEGALSLEFFDGIIGHVLLQKFNITYDYLGRVMCLAPNANFNLPIATDGSGLRWETDSTLTRIFVSHIIENSAAADEPIEAGDELLELNEKPVAELTLSDIKKALKQHGEQVSMKFQRNGYHTYEVGLELRSLWPAD